MKIIRMIVFALLILCLAVALVSCEVDEGADSTGGSGSASVPVSEKTDVVKNADTSPSGPASEGLSFATNGDGTCALTGIGVCEDVKIVIPSHAPNGDRVTSIANEAFKNSITIGRVVIPDGVTSIGNEAFVGCYGLASVTLPNSVTSIGDFAFAGCPALTSFTIPNSVTSIGYGAFEYCSGLTSISIPDSVTSFGMSMFFNCKKLTSVRFGKGVTSNGDSALNCCTGLTLITVAAGNPVYHSDGNCLIETASKTLLFGCKNSTIPTDGSVTSIQDYAFYNCTGLTSITIPDCVTGIGRDSFSGCSGLVRVTVPASAVSYLPKPQLQTVVITDGSIPDYAFVNCFDLTSVTINSGATSIGKWAFASCSKLSSITVPNSVRSIKKNAFDQCSALSSITYQGTKAQWNAISKESDWNVRTGAYTIHCTDGDIAK